MAARNRHHSKTNTNKKTTKKDPQKKHRLGTVSKKIEVSYHQYGSGVKGSICALSVHFYAFLVLAFVTMIIYGDRMTTNGSD